MRGKLEIEKLIFGLCLICEKGSIMVQRMIDWRYPSPSIQSLIGRHVCNDIWILRDVMLICSLQISGCSICWENLCALVILTSKLVTILTI